MSIATKENNLEECTSNLKEANEWLSIIGSGTRCGRSADISLVHCTKPKLVVAGQFREGGNNYWDAPSALMDEVMRIVATDITILERANNSLKDMETKDLLELETEVKEMMVRINEAKNKNNK